MSAQVQEQLLLGNPGDVVTFLTDLAAALQPAAEQQLQQVLAAGANAASSPATADVATATVAGAAGTAIGAVGPNSGSNGAGAVKGAEASSDGGCDGSIAPSDWEWCWAKVGHGICDCMSLRFDLVGDVQL